MCHYRLIGEVVERSPRGIVPYPVQRLISVCEVRMKILLRIILLLPLALPVTFVLVRWPLVFAVVGGGLCCLAFVVMGYQIATSAQRPLPPKQELSATVDNVPVKGVTVMQ